MCVQYVSFQEEGEDVLMCVLEVVKGAEVMQKKLRSRLKTVVSKNASLERTLSLGCRVRVGEKSRRRSMEAHWEHIGI